MTVTWEFIMFLKFLSKKKHNSETQNKDHHSGDLMEQDRVLLTVITNRVQPPKASGSESQSPSDECDDGQV